MTKDLEADLDKMEHQGKLLSHQKKTEQQRVDIAKEAQEKIHALADKYRSMGVDENDELIRDLSDKWWDWEETLNDIYDDVADAFRDMLEKQKDDMESALGYIVSQYDKEIESLNRQKDNITQFYQDQIDALNDLNDEIDRNIALEEAMARVATAQAKKVYLFKNGEFQYVDDVKAINDAQKELSALQRRYKLEDDVKSLENARDKELRAIDDIIYGEGGTADNPTGGIYKYKEEWESIPDIIQEKQDKLLAEQILGINLENQNWQTRIDNIEKFVKDYNLALTKLNKMENLEGEEAYSYARMDRFSTFNGVAKPAKEGQISKQVGAQDASDIIEACKQLLTKIPVQSLGSGVVGFGQGLIKDISSLSKTASVSNNNMKQNINISNISLPDVTNAKQFIDELQSFKTYTLQAVSI